MHISVRATRLLGWWNMDMLAIRIEEIDQGSGFGWCDPLYSGRAATPWMSTLSPACMDITCRSNGSHHAWYHIVQMETIAGKDCWDGGMIRRHGV